MKRPKVLHIKFESWAKFKDRTRKELHQVVAKRNKIVQPQNVLLFDSVATFQNFMSEQKYMILAAIHNLGPTSVYQLAKLVERDFANVKKDCNGLEASGFIVLEDTGDSRNTKTPKLTFDYSFIEIHLPNMIYSHNLGAAA